MTQQQLYVITVSGGQYDDAWSRMDGVTDDFEKGTAYCEKMNNLRDIAQVAMKQVEEFRNAWNTANPMPVVQQIPFVKPPSWPPSLKVTKAMRDEREQILQKYRAEYEASQTPVREWYDKAVLATKEFITTLTEDEQLGINNHYIDSYWDLEAVRQLD